MTIQWHSPNQDKNSTVFYKKKKQTDWQEETGASQPLSSTNLLVHTVELTHLEPYTEYTFKIGENKTLYRFRTLPATADKNIRFVVGGDAYLSLHLFKKMNTQIAKMNPDFIIVGGDIAYSRGYAKLFRGDNWSVKRWQTFLEQWTKQMITSDGRLIPILPVLGNHDIVSVSKKSKKQDPLFFFELFAQPEKLIAYRSIDCGDYLSLILLDTGHFTPIKGEQTQWLENTLAAKNSIPYKMAIYHISAYPSVYDYGQATAVKIRKSWVPLFEQFHLQAAFENHNHAYKRTHKIKADKVADDGVLYLGDGCWGVTPRRPKSPASLWYLAESKQTNCFWLVTLGNARCMFQAFDNNSKLIDQTELAPSF
jgi:hypothetical protein